MLTTLLNKIKYFGLEKTAQKVASNTIYQVIGKVLAMSVTILVTIIITRNFGRTGYGAFNLMQTFPALFFIIVDFGFNAIATRELSENFKHAQTYLGNLLVIRILMSAFLMLIGALSLQFFPYSPDLTFGIYLSLFLILTQALYATTNIIFQVKLRYDLSTIGLVSGSIVILILVLILTYLKAPIAWVNFSYVIGGLVTFLINIYFIRRFELNVKLHVDRSLWKFLFLQSWPIGLTFIFSQVNFRADAILLSVLDLPARFGLNNTESVAVYGLSYKIFEVSLVIPTFFMNAVYPIYVKQLIKGKDALKYTFYKSMKILFWGGLVFGALGIIFAPLMIDILGGSEFEQSVTVLRILMSGIFIFYVSQPLTWIIVTLNKQKYLPPIYFFIALFNLVANMYFIPKYSFFASSVLTWISELLILLLLILAALKTWRARYA